MFDAECFAAMCQCGGWIAVAVDEPAYNKENAKLVSGWIRDGYKIKKVSADGIRQGDPAMCQCERRRRPEKTKKTESLFPAKENA